MLSCTAISSGSVCSGDDTVMRPATMRSRSDMPSEQRSAQYALLYVSCAR